MRALKQNESLGLVLSAHLIQIKFRDLAYALPQRGSKEHRQMSDRRGRISMKFHQAGYWRMEWSIARMIDREIHCRQAVEWGPKSAVLERLFSERYFTKGGLERFESSFFEHGSVDPGEKCSFVRQSLQPLDNRFQ